MTLDFMSRLQDRVNAQALPLTCELGSLGSGDGLVLKPLPKGKTVFEYFDGTVDKQLNFEFAAKTADNLLGYDVLVAIADLVEEMTELPSQNGSYEFGSIAVTSAPYLGKPDEDGLYIHKLSCQVNLTIFKEDNNVQI